MAACLLQVNGTVMPSDPGAELAIHSHIGEIKKQDVPVIIDFELPSGEHKVLTFESYVTRADLKAGLRHKRKTHKHAAEGRSGSVLCCAALH